MPQSLTDVSNEKYADGKKWATRHGEWSPDHSMIPKPLNFQSITDLPELTWNEVSYGYSQGLLGWRTAVDLAIAKLQNGGTNPLEVELAAVGKDQTWKIPDVLQQLAAADREERDSEVKRKWLFVVLDWLYKHREQFDDPLREVEVVYADFDYPKEMTQFVRFLPSTDGYRPELHSTNENVRRLYERWREYLELTGDSYLRR